ncbi:DUF7453 family protein [Verrucomicrobiota bacterium sgz303538]
MRFYQPLLRPVLACFVVAFCTIAFVPLHAAPGDLDTSFNGTGKVTTSIRSSNDEGYSMAVQADGKIVVAGRSYNGSNYDFAVVRYNANGTLDTTFNNTGKVITPIGSGNADGYCVVVQADGKIVVAGSAVNGYNVGFALVRYNANGTLDTTFNGTGTAITPISSYGANGYSMAVQAEGKIVVAGSAINGSYSDFAVVRYNANGTLDTTFNGTGKAITSLSSFKDEGRSVAVQADGKIVIAGFAVNGSNTDTDFALVRYNVNGTLDTGFNGTGKVITPIGFGQDYGNSVAVQADGKIVVAGYSLTEVNFDFALVRYNTDGSLDTTFNGTGKAITPMGANGDYGYSVAVQADGKIAVAGSANNGRDGFALVRYNANGTLDTSFNGTGKAITPIGSGNVLCNSVAVQADGKIVVAGSAAGSGWDFAVARYNGVAPIAGPITNPANGHQYYLLSESDWVTSENVAKNLSGHLVTINDAAENQWVFDTFSAFGGVNRSLWLGLNDAATEGSFVWASGEPVTYTNWTAGTPDNGSGVKGYAHMHKPGAFGGQWDGTVSPNTSAGLDPICGVVEVFFEPIVATGAPSGVTSTDATLNATVNANGATTAVTFEYGLTNSYGSTAAATPSSLTGASNTAVSAALSGLQPSMTYHFRVKGVSSGGTSYGADATFTTLLDDSAPVFIGVPRNMTVNAPANGATAVVSWTEPTASDNVGVTSVTSTHSPGASFPMGVTTVTYTGKDAAGNTATASFTVTVIDTTKPTITEPAGGFSPVTLKAAFGTGGVVSLPDYRSQAVTYDAVEVRAVSQSPAPGTALKVGAHSVSLTVTDTSGNSAALAFTLTIENADLVSEWLFTKGATVPGTGGPGSGIPAGPIWDSFGVPAINGSGELAFVASLKLSPSGSLTGIFAGPAEAPALLVKKGDAAPGADGAVFASFKDPLFNEAGRVAFVANISGAGVTAANNSGIWTNVLGADAAAFQLVARKGGSVPGVDRARWKSFSSVALASGELNLFGTMASGAGGVSAANDLVLCRYGAGAPGGELLLREGQQLSIDGVNEKLKSFAALATVSGSPGQRRQPLDGGLHVKATLSDRRTCLLNNIGAAGLSQLEAVTGDALVDQNSQPAGTLASLGFAADASGSAWGSVFKAALKGAGTSAADNAALVGASADGLSILVRKGEEADAVRAPGALIKTFASEPVASEAGYAAVVTLSGEEISKPRDTALFWRGNGFNGLLAREGDPAPGADGALYGSFVSVALPDGATGPIFVAKLLSAKTGPAGRVTARNDLGLWAADTAGVARLLLREGDLLDGKTIASFVALPVVLSSAAQARSYNDAGTIAVRVTFSDGSQAIVRLGVP